MSKKEQIERKLRESLYSYAMKKGMSLERVAEEIAELIEPEGQDDCISLSSIMDNNGLTWMNPASRRQIRSALLDMAKAVLEKAANNAKTAIDTSSSNAADQIDKQSILDVIKLIV